VPAGLNPGTWSATATAGSTVTPTSGSGAINAQVTVAPRGQVTFTRVTQVVSGFNADFNPDNTVTLTPVGHSECDPTDPTQACDSNAVDPAPPELAFTEAPATLPATGAAIELTLRVGVLLVVGGGVLVLTTRRRPRRTIGAHRSHSHR
jgi:hypothetical protein